MRIALIVIIAAGCELACGLLLAQAASAPLGRPAASYEVKGPEEKGGLETYVVTSDYQEKPCPLYVLLPDKFDKTKRYKVLYILPALGPGDKEGVLEAKKRDLGNKFNVICVGPDFCSMPWYVDNPEKPRIRYDSYLPDVIVPFIDKTYPTTPEPEGRLLVGFSKSGMGAVSLLLRHPDVFGRAGSWDGCLMADNRPEFYGSKENFAKYYIPNLLAERAEMLRDKPARIAVMGYFYMKRDADAARKLMEQLKIPHYFDNSVKREHEWPSGWLAPLVEVLMADDMVKAKPVLTPASGAK